MAAPAARHRPAPRRLWPAAEPAAEQVALRRPSPGQLLRPSCCVSKTLAGRQYPPLHSVSSAPQSRTPVVSIHPCSFFSLSLCPTPSSPTFRPALLLPATSLLCSCGLCSLTLLAVDSRRRRTFAVARRPPPSCILPCALLLPQLHPCTCACLHTLRHCCYICPCFASCSFSTHNPVYLFCVCPPLNASQFWLADTLSWPVTCEVARKSLHERQWQAG